MSWVEFEAISEREAAGKPLDLAPQQLQRYDDEKAKARAIIKPAIDNAVRSIDSKIWGTLRNVQTPHLDELIRSVRSQQRNVNEFVSKYPAEPARESQEPDPERLEENRLALQEADLATLVSLTQTQTDALEEIVNATKNSGESQRIFNLAMLIIALFALVLAGGSLIVAMAQ